MSDWDDDDFDPTSHIDKTKVVELGLDLHKKDDSAEKHAAKSSSREAELECLEKSKQSDLEAGLALMGLANDSVKTSEKRFESLKNIRQFEAYGIEQAQLFASRSKDPSYMAFVIPLITGVCADLSKMQLAELQAILQKFADAYAKKEEAAKKVEDEKKKNQEKKKKQKKLHEEDMVIDDYADYEDKY